jgi:hypothetical protein
MFLEMMSRPDLPGADATTGEEEEHADQIA